MLRIRGGINTSRPPELETLFQSLELTKWRTGRAVVELRSHRAVLAAGEDGGRDSTPERPHRPASGLGPSQHLGKGVEGVSLYGCLRRERRRLHPSPARS